MRRKVTPTAVLKLFLGLTGRSVLDSIERSEAPVLPLLATLTGHVLGLAIPTYAILLSVGLWVGGLAIRTQRKLKQMSVAGAPYDVTESQGLLIASRAKDLTLPNSVDARLFPNHVQVPIDELVVPSRKPLILPGGFQESPPYELVAKFNSSAINNWFGLDNDSMIDQVPDSKQRRDHDPYVFNRKLV